MTTMRRLARDAFPFVVLAVIVALLATMTPLDVRIDNMMTSVRCDDRAGQRFGVRDHWGCND